MRNVKITDYKTYDYNPLSDDQVVATGVCNYYSLHVNLEISTCANDEYANCCNTKAHIYGRKGKNKINYILYNTSDIYDELPYEYMQFIIKVAMQNF